MKTFDWIQAENPEHEEHVVTFGEYTGTVYYDEHSDPSNPGWCYKVYGPNGSIDEDVCDNLEEGKRIVERTIAEEEETIFISIDMQRDEEELTEEVVKAIWADSATELKGYAVYGVEEIIVEEDVGGERTLWAYRIGNQWTTVPAAFETMTINWAE